MLYPALITSAFLAIFAGVWIHNFFKQRENTVRNYHAIEPTIQAGIVSALTVTTIATLDTGEQFPVANDTVIGDAVILNPDNTVRVDKAADFDSRYVAV